MQPISRLQWMIIGGGLVFVALIAVFLAYEWYWGLLIPFGLALVASVLLAMDNVLWFIVFTTPLSINVEFEDLGSTMNFPNEPFLIALTGLFFVRLLYYGNFLPKLLKHPLSLILIAHLTWMFFTALLSEIPLVSFKYFVSRLWFIVVFFYLMSLLLKDEKNHKPYYLLYLIPLCIAVIYTIIHHSEYGFTKKSGTWVMQPFFKEHTSYGAVLAMYFTVAWGMFFKYVDRPLAKIGLLVLAIIISVGLYFSYTRAAWLSVMIMMGIAAMLYFNWGFKRFLQLSLGGLVILALSWGSISERLEKTRAVSSDDTSEHLSSVTNVTTDASNTERLNRWKSAWRMFKERPHTGFGPGTYMFLYAPYQNPNEKTIISTNQGDVGNAHSEYIGPLADSGWPAALIILIWVVMIFYFGFRLSLHLPTDSLRATAAIAFLALVTYFSHGLVNNFLDIDKAALPVFGFTAILAVMDTYFMPRKKESLS
ncbi:MAG: O-antigen ligase family protein [Cryomorphaceae bacterium]|nr:O-antigen ligase family protein [Cryomorphaceae bacterium]